MKVLMYNFILLDNDFSGQKVQKLSFLLCACFFVQQSCLQSVCFFASDYNVPTWSMID